MLVVADHRVDVPEQQEPPVALAAEPRDEVRRVIRARARHPFDRGLRRQERLHDGEDLLGARLIA